MELQVGFKLSKATPKDMPEVWRVMQKAFKDDDVWLHVI
jgi:hypothetical protein